MNDEVNKSLQSIRIDGQMMYFDVPKVMGILNVTPDSFFDGGKFQTEDALRNRISEMIAQGADIIDIGAQSTRPSAKLLHADEEISRLDLVMKLIKTDFKNIPVSIDTFWSKTAQWAVDNGASLINDISAGEIDKKMFSTIRKLQVPYIFMHMQGNPQTMQNNPQYDNVLEDILKYLAEKSFRLRQMGVNDLIVDPGFGFGKSVVHNHEILAQLEHFQMLDLPILVGVSRKSMINKVLYISAEDALNGTSVLNTIALQKGASILRVHDIKQAVECVKLMEFQKKVLKDLL